MEAVIVLGLMIVILEIREFKTQRKMNEFMGMILDQSKNNAQLFVGAHDVFEKTDQRIEKMALSNQMISESVNEFKRELEHLSKEYELRLRTDRNDTGPIDGVIGL